MLSTYNHFRVKYELMLIEKNEWKIDCRYIFNKIIKISRLFKVQMYKFAMSRNIICYLQLIFF